MISTTGSSEIMMTTVECCEVIKDNLSKEEVRPSKFLTIHLTYVSSLGLLRCFESPECATLQLPLRALTSSAMRRNTICADPKKPLERKNNVPRVVYASSFGAFFLGKDLSNSKHHNAKTLKGLVFPLLSSLFLFGFVYCVVSNKK